VTLLRSLLFAPGNSQRKLERSADFAADGVVYDLEDAVPDGEKDTARDYVSTALDWPQAGVRMVRVNALSSKEFRSDLEMAITPNTWGIILPKVESRRDLLDVDSLITGIESRRGLLVGRVRLLGLVENARGVSALPDIARHSLARLDRLILGTVDFAADLGLTVGERHPLELHAAMSVIIASRSAELRAPLDGPFTDLSNDTRYSSDCEYSHSLGFSGRVVLHPDQVPGANTAYVDQRDLTWAHRVVEAYEMSTKSGSGSLSLDGQFIDRPVYLAALRALGESA
jgi:citrate lyase subunit beta/citryl-CoA lyase